MSDDLETQFDNLWEKVWEAADNASASLVYEQMIRLADSHGDKERAFEIRNEAFTTFNDAGLVDRILTHFAWCLARVDEDPETFDIEQLLWTYKWVVQDVTSFPTINREKVMGLCDDFIARMARRGEGARTSSYIRMCVHNDHNDLADAEAELEKWPNIDRDEWSDCPACEANTHVVLLTKLKRDAEAFDVAQPLLKRTMRCAEVPEYTYAHLLLSALRLKKYDEGARLAGNAIKSLPNIEKSHGRIGDVIAFLALTHNLAPAMRLFEDRLDAAMTGPRMMDRLAFYQGAELLMHRLADQPTKLSLPPTHPLYRDDHTYDPRPLLAWFERETRKLVDAFDRRNGNAFFADSRSEQLAMLRDTPPVKLPEKRVRRKADQSE